MVQGRYCNNTYDGSFPNGALLAIDSTQSLYCPKHGIHDTNSNNLSFAMLLQRLALLLFVLSLSSCASLLYVSPGRTRLTVCRRLHMASLRTGIPTQNLGPRQMSGTFQGLLMNIRDLVATLLLNRLAPQQSHANGSYQAIYNGRFNPFI